MKKFLTFLIVLALIFAIGYYVYEHFIKPPEDRNIDSSRRKVQDDQGRRRLL